MKRLCEAIDGTRKGAFAEWHPRAKRVVAAEFQRRGRDKLPDKGHTVLTDTGVPFTPQAPHFLPPHFLPPHFLPPHFLPGGHRVARICRACGVEHRLTKPGHPWTNGRVERLNRTRKEATVQRVHYQSTQELNEHLQACSLFARRQPRQALEAPARANPARIRLRPVTKEPHCL